MKKKINILGVNFNNLSFIEALETICGFIESRRTTFVVTPNVDHLVRLQKNEELKSIYADAALILADGMPIIWASYFLGSPLKAKISGSDLLPRFCEMASRKHYKLFFLGGRPGAALKASQVLRERYKGLNIVGVYTPPYGFENKKEENEKIVKMVKDAGPDVLFVGLGAPKQERWIYDYKDRYNAPVSIGIGVSFEFVAGIVKRAPVWIQKVGFEWLWRLLHEPKRLWKRYLIDDMKFFWLVLRQKMRNR